MCPPLEDHCLDVEAQCRTDGCDVLAIQTLHYGRLASIVQAPTLRQAPNTGMTPQALLEQDRTQKLRPWPLADDAWCLEDHTSNLCFSRVPDD